MFLAAVAAVIVAVGGGGGGDICEWRCKRGNAKVSQLVRLRLVVVLFLHESGLERTLR